ncbi:HlyU family transcriptional regulator [Cognatishimia sp. WU-CL00825]|uniref:HlyU family transcriptional regulator n=1 Tax=Cognatishimia sp. WU-CL00825 TaxID=3127658 RepID=UPI003102FF2E
MSLFSKLFGAKTAEKPEPVTHEGFLIFAEPQKDGAVYRVGARIEKEIGGEVKVHQMVRADSFPTAEAATEVSLLKAKQFIDQQGERLFSF